MDLEKMARVEKESASSRSLYNGINLRLCSLKIIEHERQCVIVTARQPVYYFKGLGTNYALDKEPYKLRSVLHADKKLCPLHESLLANPIGVNILVLTEDGQMIMQHRSMTVAVRPGEACSSASGTVDDADTKHKSYHPILAAVYREMHEEIALRPQAVISVIFLGAVREFYRGGELTDFFFATKCNLQREEIVRQAKEEGNATDSWEWEGIELDPGFRTKG